MSRISAGNLLHVRIKGETIAALVAGVLRREHENSGTALKSIQKASGASYDTACKWHRARNAPRAAHLLELAKRYPNILRIILELIGRNDVWELCVMHAIPEKMLVENSGRWPSKLIYTDKSVSINVIVSTQIGQKLNQRQLWFLGQLQQGYKVSNSKLISVWKISSRTAYRDISELVKVGMVKRTGTKKIGYYKLV